MTHGRVPNCGRAPASLRMRRIAKTNSCEPATYLEKIGRKT